MEKVFISFFEGFASAGLVSLRLSGACPFNLAANLEDGFESSSVFCLFMGDGVTSADLSAD